MSLFITFEGIEGSGKTTQIKLLSDFLLRKGHHVLLTREPGGTSIGDQIRKILLDAENRGMNPLCELFLYEADRAQHCEEVIRPALKEGKIVLCDRFTDSTLAYQEEGRLIPSEWVHQMNRWATDGLEPDLTLYLDCPVELGLGRARQRISQQAKKEDRFEQEEMLFHERVRDRYLKIAKEEKHRFYVVKGTDDIETVHREIVRLIEPRLK
jgi:dTMP kinase